MLDSALQKKCNMNNPAKQIKHIICDKGTPFDRASSYIGKVWHVFVQQLYSPFQRKEALD